MKWSEASIKPKVLICCLVVLLAAGSVWTVRLYRPTASNRDNLERIESFYSRYRQSFLNVPTVSADQLLTIQKKGDVVLIDVRQETERRISTIANAISVEQFQDSLEKHKADRIVTYCTIGYRSGIYAQKLQDQGFRAYNLNGGILAWIHAGHEVFDQQGQTRRVHVFSKKWNLVPKGYQGIW